MKEKSRAPSKDANYGDERDTGRQEGSAGYSPSMEEEGG